MDGADQAATRTTQETIRDGHARVVRIAEALADGDLEFVSLALDDLAHDLWRAVEQGHEWGARAA